MKKKDKKDKKEKQAAEQPARMTQEQFEKGCVLHSDNTITTGVNYDFCKH